MSQGTRPTALMTIAATLVLQFPLSTAALDNGVARTPPMGWSTFNAWGGVWGEPILKEIADSLVATGLRDCGYTYVNCDGHNVPQKAWPGSGFPAAENLSAGWAKKVADYVHARKLKFGVYMTSSSNPQATATDLVTSEIDYLKHDDWAIAGQYTCAPIFKQVGDAIRATGRPVVYSTNSCKDSTVANVFRTGSDIKPDWPTIMVDFDQNYGYLKSAKPGYWPDADMLEVGVNAYVDGVLKHILTPEEDRAHFSMWCMMSAPLIMGYNFTRKWATDYMQNVYTLDAVRFPMANHIQSVAIQSNTELIALDQDTIGRAGKRIKGQGALEVWVKNCADGAKAVALFNRTGSTASMAVTQTELEWGSAAKIYVRDLWQHADQPTFSGTFTKTVASHAAEIYKMDIKPISQPTDILRKMDRSIAWLRSQGHEVFPQRMFPGVLAGTDTRAKVFDVRGRALSVRQPALPGRGVLIIAQENNAGKALWSCAAQQMHLSLTCKRPGANHGGPGAAVVTTSWP